MRKIGKRFVALLVVFMSMVSLLPMPFGDSGKAANAAVANTTINVEGSKTEDKVTVSGDIYTTETVHEYFTITVPYKKVSTDKIKPGETGIVDQRIIITKVNGFDLSAATTTAEKNIILDKIGCKLATEGNQDFNNGKEIGVKIEGLPLGVNKIEYQIEETTQTRKKVLDDAGNIIDDSLEAEVKSVYPSTATSNKLTIQHAKTYVQSKIETLEFESYIGKESDYDESSDNNKQPFKFTSFAEADPDMPLSYTFNVPDGTDTLKYVMSFKDQVQGSTVFKNGKQDTASIVDNKITGNLANLGQRDLIVIKLGSGTNVEKAYAIEINYNTLKANEDFTLRDPGITKFNYNESDEVRAYIGKHFIQSNKKDTQGILTYNGTITINKRAEMISLEPKLGRSEDNTAFVISNHYDNGSKIENSKLINGKQFVDFNKGTDNEIWVDIYEGKDGNTVGTVLARYKLKVIVEDTNPPAEKIKFSFGDAYLTQPGRKDSVIQFNTDRRTYDLYSGDTVDVTLNSPQTSQKEYFKVWLSDSVDNESAIEVKTDNPSNNMLVDVSKSKRMILQAYYDEIVYKKDADGNYETDPVTGDKVIEKRIPSPLGQKYVFYIAKNLDDYNPGGGDETSDNAALSGLKFNNGVLKGIDGSSGFSSNKYSYKVTVPKDDTDTKITATAESKNVKSIIATITETGDEYELTSGEPFQIPLNSSGTTTVQIEVTAGDGITKKAYNITISNDTRGSSTLLKNVILSEGDFDFDPDNDVTKVRVDQKVLNIKVTPIPEDSNSRVTVDGDRYKGNPITVSLKGSQMTEIEIKVTAEDGSASQTYTLEVYRSDSDLPDDDDDDNNYEGDIFYDEFDECWVDLSKYEEWGEIKGKPAYFDKKGRQVKDAWITTDGKLYYLNKSGYRSSGWRTESDGKTYYLDPSTGEMRKGWMNQNNSWYYLGPNGVMKTGWLYQNNKWYYFTPNGQMVTNQNMYIDGQVYRFAQDGTMI